MFSLKQRSNLENRCLPFKHQLEAVKVQVCAFFMYNCVCTLYASVSVICVLCVCARLLTELNVFACTHVV